MSAATVRLSSRQALSMDPVKPNQLTASGVLLTMEGVHPGDVMNCALIPLDRVRAVIASLELVAAQAGEA